MSGMKSDDEVKTLDAAQGNEAAKLFLTQMIAHHEGAVEMARAESTPAGKTRTRFSSARTSSPPRKRKSRK